MGECCKYYHCRMSGSVVSRLRSRLQQGHSIWPQWHCNIASSAPTLPNVLGHLQGWVGGGLARCLLQVAEVLTGHIQSTWNTNELWSLLLWTFWHWPRASFVYEWGWSPNPNIELMDFLLLAAPGLWTTRKKLSETSCWYIAINIILLRKILFWIIASIKIQPPSFWVCKCTSGEGMYASDFRLVILQELGPASGVSRYILQQNIRAI